MTKDEQTTVKDREDKLPNIPDEEDIEYPPFKTVIAVMAAIWLAFFVVALERTIIGTAVPTISKHFNSFGDIAWYEAGFLLPICVLQLSFGQVYKYYSTKWVLVTSLAFFEIGSIICATAPSSNALIIGRVVTGIGAAGIGPGAFLLINYLVPKDQIPKYTGSLGSVFGITSILGPILGGYLTSITWRWCFWISVPIGGIAGICLLLLTPKTKPSADRAKTWIGKVLDLDPLGFLLIAPAVTCLLIAIEFGGVRYAWNSGTVIALFVLFGVFILTFIGSQIYRGEQGTVPPRIFLQRTVFFSCISCIGIGSVLVMYSFYLPIWFQVIQGKSPQSSGLSLIAELLSVVVAVILCGIFVSAIGYYTPGFIFGSCVLMVGAGLISTWTVDVSRGKWIGYQIVVGIGLGLVLQAPIIATQNVLSRREAPTGLALINTFNQLGGTIFVPVGQSLLESSLVRHLKPILPNIDAQSLAGEGATTLRTMVSSAQLGAVLRVYNDSLRSVWYLALGLSAVVLLASLGVEWRSVKEGKKGKAKKDEEEGGKEGEDVEMQGDEKSGEKEENSEVKNHGDKSEKTTEVGEVK